MLSHLLSNAINFSAQGTILIAARELSRSDSHAAPSQTPAPQSVFAPKFAGSDKPTHSVSSSKRTVLGEVLIPTPFNELKVRKDYATQFPQSAGVKTITICQIDHWC